ncbi:type III polyketide synthase [Bacillus sp. FJAT-45350]|uniref:type III polyketide synthase n=1 Tax=Bacillus sp. FJAT-45350 TaxID=2011014 RepID=UPI000BB913E8|nr:3-oxoacyl-[acyl-carrier-protein] synthase III C-terminal domain-containing protein [Bacillus sp. FJAT-45350]
MPIIISVSTITPSNKIIQSDTAEFARELFHEEFHDINRLLQVFDNGQIKHRNFSMPLDWYYKDHTLKERNDLYIQLATEYGKEAIELCLSNEEFLDSPVDCSEIDAIYFISSTGFSTPTIEAKIANLLPFKSNIKRVPIWGLGCAGGASGLSRAYEFCLAYPKGKVLVLCTELCSLTFQKEDQSKSNLIGTSLFADGVACALVAGDEVNDIQVTKNTLPVISGTDSQLMPNSEDVMGWEVKNDGLNVVFSRSIPSLIKNWFGPVVQDFLKEHQISLEEVDYFVAHPGGKKVLDAYEKMFDEKRDMTSISRKILEDNGNMSAPTVLFVLNEFMKKDSDVGQVGLLGALGPGFSSELVLLEWK